MNHLISEATPRLTAKRKWVLTNWKKPGTMRMVEARTVRIGKRVYNTTICGMMPTFERYGLIELVGFDLCKESNNRAGYWKLTAKGESIIISG